MPTPRHGEPSRSPAGRGVPASPENIARAWLFVRRRKDGLKMREIAAEFGVSVQFVCQQLDRYKDLTAYWRHKHQVCASCGKGAPE